MNNRNSFRGEVTVRKNGYEDQSIKGAIGYTMPNRPNQAISLMKQQIDRQITNQIMFIPFPQVRNVIASFMKPFPRIDQDFSQILVSQYSKNKLLQKLDNSINQNITRAYHQKIKLEKILKCFQKAQGLKKAVTQLKTKIRDSRQEDLGDRIRQIQNQYERKKFDSRGNEQKCAEIELQKNKKIIHQFQTHYTQYQQRNNDFIKLDFTFSEVREFCKQMQKTIPIIWRYEGVQDSSEEIRSQSFVQYFRLTIKQQLKPLIKFIHESQTWLEMFRKNVKSQSWANSGDSEQFKLQQTQLKQMNLAFEQIQQKIRSEVYQKLKEISKLDQHIVRNLSSEISTNMSAYERFVETYTDIKQVCNTKNKWKDFHRIIAKEEKLLSDHMRLNCGLVVYYKPTDQFQQFATGLSKRTYVEQIFRERLAPLNNAIKFINEEYSLMYKRACEDMYSGSKLRKDQVNRKLVLFQKSLQSLEKQNNILQLGEENHYQYLTHLTLSLNRLMALAK